jgi:haloacid dehalogenase superfamily, subfamily IA, variant 3 with third motif having DD or ED/haloacid dehalogenase superfamily, subfamily IA, variant 1 with third motif having Dx(3-4)D or Dx(3-4)E
MSTLKGLLFDADGTLIDTQDIILTSMRRTVCDLYGYDCTDAQLMQGVGTPLLDQMAVFASGDMAKAEAMVADYREHNDSIHDAGIKSFLGVSEALAQLRAAGYRMGVVTSKRHMMAERGLELTGILEFFEFIIGSDDWPEHKPDPGPIVHGCELLGIPAKECAYIGDSPYDIQAGNAAGCTTYAALWGMFPADALKAEHPDFCCKSMAELATMLHCGKGDDCAE